MFQFYGGSAGTELLYGNTGGTKTVTVAGVGTASVSSTEFGVLAEDHASGLDLIGFSDSLAGFSFATETTTPVGDQLSYSLGPLTGELYEGTAGYEITSVGELQFANDSLSDTATFTAVGPVPPTAAAVTPEPSSIALLGTGLLGIACIMRKRSDSA